MKHLSDTEIQSYLDRPSGGIPGPLEDHLRTCAMCRRRLDEYRALFARLADDSGMPVYEGLTDAVMARVAARPHPEHSGIYDLVLAAGGTAIAAAAIWLFVGLSPLYGGLARLSSAVVNVLARGAGPDAGPGPYPIAAAAAVILVVHLINGLAFRLLRARGADS